MSGGCRGCWETQLCAGAGGAGKVSGVQEAARGSTGLFSARKALGRLMMLGLQFTA